MKTLYKKVLAALSNSALQGLIKKHLYEGIRDQDGWETLELTIRKRHTKDVADQLLKALKK
jgi:hypothetical protein